MRRPFDQGNERGRQVASQVGQAAARVATVGVDDFRHAPSGHRKLARHQVVEQHADRIEVGLDGCGMALEHFRRQVERRAGTAGGAAVRGHVVAQAEVHQHVTAAGLAHHVLRFDVAVHETRRMDGRERPTEVAADQCGFGGADRAAALHDRVERVAGNQFHPQCDPAVQLLGAVDGHHVGMTNPREQAGLAQQVLGCRAGRRRFQELERDLAIEPGIDRAEHLALGAAAEARQQREMSPVRDRQRVGERVGRTRRRPAGIIGLPVTRTAQRIQFAQGADESEVVGGRGRGFERIPIDRFVVRNRGRH